MYISRMVHKCGIQAMWHIVNTSTFVWFQFSFETSGQNKHIHRFVFQSEEQAIIREDETTLAHDNFATSIFKL